MTNLFDLPFDITEIIENNFTYKDYNIIFADLPDRFSPYVFQSDIEKFCNLLQNSVSDDRLKQIELYLSAHFTTLRERQLSSKEFGDSENEFLGEVGMGLDSSIYGQQSKVLDTTGTLVNQGKAKATFDVP